MQQIYIYNIKPKIEIMTTVIINQIKDYRYSLDNFAILYER